MNIGLIVAYGEIIGIVVAVTLAAVVGIGVAVSRPKYPVYLLIGVLIFFSAATWGRLEVTSTIYDRGTGQFNFSFVNLYLWGTALAIALASPFRRTPAAPCDLTKYFWLFNLFFSAHVVAGLASDVPFADIMSYNGVLNVLNMSVMIFVLQQAFDNPRDLDELTKLFMVSVFARGIFGLVRFAFFGGDPTNVYASYEKIAIKLTFFDINDGLIATVAAFYAAWRLAWDGKTMTRSGKWFYGALLVVEILVVVLSYRRTAIGGFALAGLLFVILQPKPRRLLFLLIGSVVFALGLGVIVTGRLQQIRGTRGGILEALLPDLFAGKSGDVSTGRFGELFMAFDTIRDHWLLGAGTWAEFRGGVIGYHFGVYDFVHSGIVHIWLKTGLVGLVLFLGGLLSYIVFVHAKRRMIEPGQRAFFEAGYAGFLFSIPNVLVGTPIIEFRTMLLFGLVLAIPYLAYHSRMQTAGAQP
jgi:O-antigen ligase